MANAEETRKTTLSSVSGAAYKYCPKSLVPGSNTIEKYQTIGIVLSM